MTDIEAKKLIKILQSAYPRQVFEPDTIAIYTRMLNDIPYDIAQHAIHNLVSTSVFLPSIAEIRKAAAEYGCRIPNVDDAQIETHGIVSRASFYDRNGVEWSNKLLAKAVEVMGGLYEMGGNEQPERMWAEWRRIYAGLREREITRLQTERDAIARDSVPFLPSLEVSLDAPRSLRDMAHEKAAQHA